MTIPSTTPPVLFGCDELIPVVIQDATTDAVLMVAFMNELALQRTRETGRTHFWSRSRSKLWKKGETSGHEQLVESISVNCESNSLLITVHQIGAACHDGYPTCYYRQLNPDDTLAVIRERWFDPAAVYDANDRTSLEAKTRRWYGAYEYLRDHDLDAESGTSRRLHDSGTPLSTRVADELRELAGVLSGAHHHVDLVADIELEGSQCLYWLVLGTIRGGVTWDQLRPDRALITGDATLSLDAVVKILLHEAEAWADPNQPGHDLAARTHAAMALVAQAALTAHVPPVSLIRRDLNDLADKPYLRDYFASANSSV